MRPCASRTRNHEVVVTAPRKLLARQDLWKGFCARNKNSGGILLCKVFGPFLCLCHERGLVLLELMHRFRVCFPVRVCEDAQQQRRKVRKRHRCGPRRRRTCGTLRGEAQANFTAGPPSPPPTTSCRCPHARVPKLRRKTEPVRRRKGVPVKNGKAHRGLAAFELCGDNGAVWRSLTLQRCHQA